MAKTSDTIKNTDKITKVSAVDLVFEKMKETIKSGVWKIGEKIPSEGELANQYGVNRLTVRLALQKLSTLHLVQTQAGEGTFVTDFDFENYIGQVAEFVDAFNDVVDFRKTIEISCCELAIKNASNEELEHLHELLQLYLNCRDLMRESRQYNEAAFQAMIQADVAFHEYICYISHNTLLYGAFKMGKESIYRHAAMMVGKRLRKRVEFQKLDKQPQSQTLIHTGIYQAIMNKDFETCKEIYLVMLNRDLDLFEK